MGLEGIERVRRDCMYLFCGHHFPCLRFQVNMRLWGLPTRKIYILNGVGVDYVECLVRVA